MDLISLTIYVAGVLALIIFWRIGVFRRIYETLQYIHENGWDEYKQARKRYDEHERLKKQAQPTRSEKREYQKMALKQLRK